jgi:peptide/nickel transport system substrate-binding protein
MAVSKYPHGFDVTLMVAGGNASEKTTGQILQAELAPLGIKVAFNQVDPNQENTDQQQFKYQLAMSYWTMDIADPERVGQLRG